MKASASPRTWIVSLLAVVACGSFAFAQDVVVQKNGVRSEGQILGVAAGKIKIKVGPVETTIPLDQAATVTKDAPKSYTDGVAAWDAGNAAQALRSSSRQSIPSRDCLFRGPSAPPPS